MTDFVAASTTAFIAQIRSLSQRNGPFSGNLPLRKPSYINASKSTFSLEFERYVEICESSRKRDEGGKEWQEQHQKQQHPCREFNEAILLKRPAAS